MRLIDADRLLSERMKSMYYHLPNGDIAVPVVDIENAPTIEERKTGKWVPDPRNVYEMRFVCTNCMTSAKVPTIGFTAYKPVWGYCPNCGAKMEG